MNELQLVPDNGPRHTLSPEFLHELRTPLNHIIGYSEMLAEQAGIEGQTSYVPDLQKIRSAGRKLLALLNHDVVQPVQDEPGVTSEPFQFVPGSWQALILVVDDDAANREVLARRLERQGYETAAATNGLEALQAVRDMAFDLVLLDIMMPEMDGYEVLRQLKADEALRHIPVIMISALDDLDSVVRCIELGAEDYLPKPFEPALLKARVGACLTKKRALDRERQLFQELELTHERLRELERSRDDLTHMVIHDLRTPLTSLISGIQTVDVMGDLNSDQREAMQIAVEGGQTLLGMINNLLDVDKMESGAMELDYTLLDAKELVRSAMGQVAQLAEDGRLGLVKDFADDLPFFEGDEASLRRTLVNLLGNAIKFTPAGGKVTVSVAGALDKKSLSFSVTDTGEGIPKESFDRIFEKFGQVATRKNGRGMSTGLGLTFCKLAIEAHGGNIQVGSAPGQGTVFTFNLPTTCGR